MRCVSLVDRIKFEFSGNVHKDAIQFGDVDNDLCNELVIANLAGILSIFKGMQSKPWAVASNLGMVSTVVVGDIVNMNKNYVVSISIEGSLYIFNVVDNILLRDESKKLGITTKSPSVVSCGEEATECVARNKITDPLILRPFHSQKLPANTKAARLADIDSDGQVELIVGLTDRVVRTYKWVKVSELNGKLVGIHKWEFADQIGTISLNPSDVDNGMNIIVSQPGGTYAKLECWGKKKPKSENGESVTEEVENGENSEKISGLKPLYYDLDSSKMRNRSISTEVVGGIHGKRKSGEDCRSLLAVGTIDGTLMLVDDKEILWSLQVDHQVFALSKLDVINDGKEELIACAWDGQTYIVNQDRYTVRFEFEEAVCAFIAGHYTVDPEKSKATVPCLAYATFSNTIHLYYNVKLSSIKPSNLRETLSEETVDNAQELMKLLNIDEKNFSIEKLCSNVLYNYPSFVDDTNEEVKIHLNSEDS